MVDDDHPDEVSLPESAKPTPQPHNPPKPQAMQPPSRPLARSHSAGNPPRPPQPPAQVQQNPRPGGPNHPVQNISRPQQNQNRPQTIGSVQNSKSSNSGRLQAPAQGPSDSSGAAEAVGFFSARAVKQLTGQKEDEIKLPSTPSVGQVFNPHAETPSIFKTPGIDYSQSRPLGRDLKHYAPLERKLDDDSGIDLGPAPSTPSANSGFSRAGPAQQPGPGNAQKGNVVNPQLNQTRRIGAPMGPGSPLGNRGQYRPPTFKRPPPGEGNHVIAGGGVARQALAEVSTNGTAAGAAAGPGGGIGGDPKRQKIG